MSPGSFGFTFNQANGGVYAMNWDTNGMKVWFFPRSNIPQDLASGSLDFASFPEPDIFYAFGAGTCDPSFFQRMKMIINLTFCGDFAVAPK